MPTKVLDAPPRRGAGPDITTEFGKDQEVNPLAAPHVCSDLSVEQHQVLWRMSHKAHRYGDQAGCWTGDFRRDITDPIDVKFDRAVLAVQDLLDQGILLRRGDSRGRSSYKLVRLCGCKELPLALSTVSKDTDEVPRGTSCGSAGVEAQSNHMIFNDGQVSKLDSICGTPEQTFGRRQDGDRGQDVREIRTVTGPRRIRKKFSRRRLHRDEPMGLAWYFEASYREHHRGEVTGTDLRALATGFSKWMTQDGVPPGEIRAMIDAFVRAKRRNTGAPPWRSFLYSSGRWQQKAKKVAQGAEGEAHRFDKDGSYWLGR